MKKNPGSRLLIIPGLTTLFVLPARMALGKVELDPGLASYDTVSGVSGNLLSIGPDTFIVKYLDLIHSPFRGAGHHTAFRISKSGG